LRYRDILKSINKGGENVKPLKPFLFRLTSEADKILEEAYLKLKRKKSKSLLLNELILSLNK